MFYKHDLHYDYPERTDEHMLVVKKIREVNLDESYPYLQKSAWYKFKRGIFWVLVQIIIFPLLVFTHGLRIYGRENYKKNKHLFKNGAITVSNHVFMWDFLCVMKAIRPKLAFFPAWKTNIEGPNGPLIRWAGGIPVPTDNVRSMIKFSGAMDEVLESKRWLHVFPEGSLWFFYPGIRPLKKAVFKYAVKYDRPILPVVLTFRPRKGIAKLFGKTPRVDLHVGEPILPDKTLPPKEAETKIHKQTYHVMQVMAGITPDSPEYNSDYLGASYKRAM